MNSIKLLLLFLIFQKTLRRLQDVFNTFSRHVVVIIKQIIEVREDAHRNTTRIDSAEMNFPVRR